MLTGDHHKHTPTQTNNVFGALFSPFCCRDPWALQPMKSSHQHTFLFTQEKVVREGAVEKPLCTECDPQHCLTEEAECDLWQKHGIFVLKNSLLIFWIKFMELVIYRLFNFCHKTLSQHNRNKAQLPGLGGQMDVTEVPT